jgi:hypothetical protein
MNRRGIPLRHVFAATALLFGVLLAAPLAAKELAAAQGASIDMPSGFTAGDGDGRTRFSYFDPAGEMELDILVYEPQRFSTAGAMAAETLSKLGSRGDTSTFSYAGRDAAISELAFRRTARERIRARRGKAAARPRAVAHVDAARFDAYSSAISCLDGFSIGRGPP